MRKRKTGVQDGARNTQPSSVSPSPESLSFGWRFRFRFDFYPDQSSFLATCDSTFNSEETQTWKVAVCETIDDETAKHSFSMA